MYLCNKLYSFHVFVDKQGSLFLEKFIQDVSFSRWIKREMIYSIFVDEQEDAWIILILSFINLTRIELDYIVD